MTEASTPQPSPPAEQLPWGISYLREDIQDLRQDLRENIQGVRQEMHQGFHALNSRIDGRIDETNRRIDELNRSLSDRLDSRFTWTIATMVALAGVIVAVIKL